MTQSHRLRAFISGCEGLALTPSEKAFFRAARPLGIILFKRNCESVEQIRRLVDEYRECIGAEQTLVLIDQEGGRVQRLCPPVWPAYPRARAFNALYTRDSAKGLAAAKAGARLIARDLLACGINTNCAPVLDLPIPGAHDIIGDRAYGMSADEVIALGRAVMEGYLESSVLPVIKHIPGHGRAFADSHVALPTISATRAELEETDFVPFRALRDAPLGMTAHVLMPELDPAAPASASPGIVAGVIRGSIGFDGLLMCDDIGMNALSGGMEDRARAVLAAGCDVVLHCSGDLRQMEAVAAVTPELRGEPLRRFSAATARLTSPEPLDIAAAEALLGEVSAMLA